MNGVIQRPARDTAVVRRDGDTIVVHWRTGKPRRSTRGQHHAGHRSAGRWELVKAVGLIIALVLIALAIWLRQGAAGMVL